MQGSCRIDPISPVSRGAHSGGGQVQMPCVADSGALEIQQIGYEVYIIE
jgi:hypothetical protein